MNDNQKIIDLEYRLNYFPGLTSLIKIVQKSNPQISKKEIVDFFEKDITTQLTKKQPKIKPIKRPNKQFHINQKQKKILVCMF